jgi:glycosyltransferase involved in cell wall biosynthesis
MVTCVIPAYKAAATIVDVVRGALQVCDNVIVVDDACPQNSGDVASVEFARELRVHVIRHPQNLGVGGAMKTGLRRAVEMGADFIVKIDSDGQMDPRYVPDLVRLLELNPKIALVKGNRFIDGSIARVMPGLRLIGNSALTLLVRMTTGYWSGIDPTNGFLVMRARSLERISLDSLSDRYYFEISLLCAFGMRKVEIAEAEIPAVYNSAPSSLSIARVLLTFPFALAGSFVKRILWQYLIADMNVGSLLLLVGITLTSLSAYFGISWWHQALQSGIPTTPGSAILAFAPLMMGFQLLLNALLYDVQFASRVNKFSCEDVGTWPFGERRALRR